MKISMILWCITIADNNLVVKPALNQNYTNLFNPITKISYSVVQTSLFVNHEIYNIKGQKVRSLINQNMVACQHSIIWNGTNDSNQPVSSEIYLYKLNTCSFEKCRKMILLK